ncbi:MAG TPA: GntR family transcriptional regulator [Firmicutes bacterium]|nr:GntR family transcriptional regulator [Bacillota bacterium]
MVFHIFAGRFKVQISTRSPVSLYVQLKEIIAREIREQKLKPHDRIPSERELCEKYKLSRTTVRQGIGLAISEGLLYRIQGKGTFVADPKIDQGLVRLTGFEETILGRGLTPSMKVIEAQLITGDVQVTSILGLPMGADVAAFQLLGIASSVPLVLFYYYLPAELGMEAINIIRNCEAERGWFSFTRYYREKKQIDPGVARQTFEATTATPEQAGIMQLPVSSALFKVTSIIYTRQGNPIELRHAFYRGDRYKFNISRDVIS